MSRTSLTIRKCDVFAKNASENEQLGCSNLAGFCLLKRKASAVFIWRYTNPQGKRKKLGLGKYALGVNPQEVALTVLDYQRMLSEGIDPLVEIELNKQRQAQELKQNSEFESNTVGKFFRDVYKPHLTNTRANQGTLAIIKNNFEHLFERSIESLQAVDIREWESTRKAKGIKHSTLKRDYGAFKAMLNYAAGKKANDPNDQPALKENPLANVYLSKLTAAERDELLDTPVKDRRPLTPKELRKLHRGLDELATHIGLSHSPFVHCIREHGLVI